jgi:hypothetical protein
MRSVSSACSARKSLVREQRSFRLLAAIFLPSLLLVPLSTLQQLEMPCLLRQKLLRHADQSGGALMLDLVLRDDFRVLRLDYSCAGLRACALPIVLSVRFLGNICCAAQDAAPIVAVGKLTSYAPPASTSS